MKAIWKIINTVLVLTAAASLLYLGNMYFQSATFYPQEYIQKAQELSDKAEALRQDTAARIAQETQQEQALNSRLSSLGSEGAALEEELSALRAANEEKTAALAGLQKDAEDAEHIREVTLEFRDAYARSIRALEDKIRAGETDAKICYWSFDDGPSYHTQEVLDICKEHGAYVTFFTSREANEGARGDDPEVERSVLRAMITQGHAICNHTFSHQYGIYGNVYGQGIDSFREMVIKQDEWVEECTGFKPDIFRFPGGSSFAFSKLPKDQMLTILDELGYQWIDWSCDVYDNGKADPSAHDVYVNGVYEVKTLGTKYGNNIAVVLSHDWNANTVAAFKLALPELQSLGYIFLPLFSQSWTIGNTEIIFT